MSLSRNALAACVLIALACGGPGEPPVPTPQPDLAPAPAPDPEPSAGPAPAPRITDDLDALAEGSMDTIVEAVRAVRWEPYPGFLRGPQATLAMGSGNALDQAWLLVTALEKAGHDARFASGELSEAQAEALLQRWSGAQGAFDPALAALARDHTWVEVQVDGEWVPIDPVLELDRGEAPADADRSFHKPDGDAFQQLLFVVKVETAGGDVETQGPFGGPVAAMDHPVHLVVEGTPLREGGGGEGDPPEEIGGLASPLGGGMRRGLTGRGAEPEPAPAPAPQAPAERVGMRWTWAVDLTGDPKAFSREVRDDDPDSAVVREWLEFTLHVPGAEPRTFSRTLYAGDGGAPEWRRYDLVVPRGPVALDDVERLVQGFDADAWRSRSEALAGAEAAAETVADARGLVQEAGRVGEALGWLFAAESDLLAERSAASFRVALTHPEPRLLIVSQETAWVDDDTVHTEVFLDLRSDRVGAWDMPGGAPGAALAFQGARGMLESGLEGAIVQAATGRSAVTTAAVMQAAGQAGVPIELATPQAREALTDGLPDRARLVAALDAGRHVAFPARPVEVDGEARFGWWDIDPASGAFVGVLQGGQHQAMVSYTVTLEKVGLNDDMGFALGLLVGSSATQWLMAAKMLEVGEITEAVKDEIRTMMGKMLCAACPSGNLSAGGGVSVGADCYELFSRGVSVGMGGSIAFCDQYRAGVECAMAVMLDGIGSQTPGVEAGAGATMQIPWDCD